MKRDIVISVIIGALLTYLPFWQWERFLQQGVATLAFAAMTFVVLTATEKKGVKSR